MAERTSFSQLQRGNTVLLWMIAIAGLVAVLLAVSTRSTLAQNATCSTLQAQLAQIETGRGATPSRQFIRYDRAVRDQKVQIRKTERAARRNACQVRRSNKCNRINSSLGKMYANLQALERAKANFSPRGGTRADRARIVRALKQNGCVPGNQGARQASVEPRQQRRLTLLEQIFGTKTYSSQGGYSEDPDSRAGMPGSGTFRTLCVRTCDGYYFPISFSTTKKRFEEDLSQCQQMCPGTETALFYHSMPGGDAEKAISYRTGKPYADLANAFSYRKQIDPQCGCRSSTASFKEVAGSIDINAEAPTPTEPAVPLPEFRQDIVLGEETLQSREGNMTVEKLAAIAKGDDGDNGETGGDKTIRIVGPAFFPVQ